MWSSWSTFLTLLRVSFLSSTTASSLFFYASNPVTPNETLLLLGGDASAMLATTFINLCVRNATPTNCLLLPNVQATDASAKAVLPDSAPTAVYTATPCSGPAGAPQCAQDAPLSVNSPSVYWTQLVSQGSVLRTFGDSLAFAPPPSGGMARCVLTADGGSAPALAAAAARLVPSGGGGASLPLVLTFASCYALTAAVPAGAPAGDYALEVNNGLPGCGWVTAPGAPITLTRPVPWPTTVFNVSALGSVWRALAAAAAAGGGVVYFPRGRYAFNENATLNEVPPRTVLQGEGTDLVEFHWPDMARSPQANGSDSALVQGSGGAWAIANVTLFVQGNFTVPVISDAGADGLIVRGVIVRANPYYMTLEPVNQTFHGRSMPVGSGFNSGVAVSVSGCGWEVTDSDLLGGSHAVSIFVTDAASPTWFARPCNGVLARNVLVGGWGQYRLEGARGVIVEHNVMRGGGMNAFGSWISTYYAKATEGVYFAENSVGSVMGGDRELLSFDGGGGAYLGGVASVSADGLLLTLESDPVFAGYIPPGPRLFNYTEAAVVVLEGRGKGQVGRVARNGWDGADGLTNRSWLLRAPFALPLDATSVISIVPFRGDIVVTGNDFFDGGAIQLYAMAVRVAVTENTATRTSGFLSWGLNPHDWGVQPNFFTTFNDNTVVVGNAWGGQTGGFGTVSAGDQGNLTLNRGVVFRRNTLLNNAPIAISGSTVDVVVEHCVIRNNEVGIAIANATSGVWLRGNYFQDVGLPFAGDVGCEGAGMDCFCNCTDPFTGVALEEKPFAAFGACGTQCAA